MMMDRKEREGWQLNNTKRHKTNVKARERYKMKQMKVKGVDSGESGSKSVGRAMDTGGNCVNRMKVTNTTEMTMLKNVQIIRQVEDIVLQ